MRPWESVPPAPSGSGGGRRGRRLGGHRQGRLSRSGFGQDGMRPGGAAGRWAPGLGFRRHEHRRQQILQSAQQRHAASAPGQGFRCTGRMRHPDRFLRPPTDFRDTRRIVGPSCVMMREHEPEPVPSGLRVHRAAHASARSGPGDEGCPHVAGGTTARARRDEAGHKRPHFSRS